MLLGVRKFKEFWDIPVFAEYNKGEINGLDVK
jgi:hypothetical protein